METLESKENKVELIPLRLEDVDALYSLTDKNREHLREWLPWVDTTRTVDDTKGFVEMALKQQTDKSGIHFGIWYKRELVGVVGYHYVNYANKKATIGYWLDKDSQGKGIMTAAVNLIIKYGFENLDLHRVEIMCAVENEASNAVALRLGFEKEGTIKESEWVDDHFVDQNIYGKLRT